MSLDRKAIILIATNILLLLLTQMVNHSLAQHAVFLSVASLFIIPAILQLSSRWGMLTVAIQGLLIDSTLPTEHYGLHFILFITLFTLLSYFRSAIRRANLFQVIMVCVAINGSIMILLGIFMSPEGLLSETAYWIRILTDFLFSSVLLLLITNWFISLQEDILFFFGADLEPNEEEA